MSYNLQIKSLGLDGRFAGYASVFNVTDNQRDVVEPGAFTHTLQKNSNAIKLLWQHQMEEPIGVIDALFEDEQGLYLEARLLLEVARAREAHALLKTGAVKGLSIGYSPIRYKINPDTGVRHLLELELWEVSLVTFPANPSALVTVVKSAGTMLEHKIPIKPLEESAWEVAKNTGQLIALHDALVRAEAALR